MRQAQSVDKIFTIANHTPDHCLQTLRVQKFAPRRVKGRALFQRLAIWIQCRVLTLSQCFKRPLETFPNLLPSLFLATRLGKASQKPVAQQCAEAIEQAAPAKDKEIVIVGIFHTIPMYIQGDGAPGLPSPFPKTWDDLSISNLLSWQLFSKSWPNCLFQSKMCKHFWVVLPQGAEHTVRKKNRCLFQSILGCLGVQARSIHIK